MAKSDVLVRMKADTSGYNANIAKARRQLDQFRQDNLTLGGILNQSTKSIMAAAAQYASFAAILGTVSSGIATVISEGTAMAREMEGVKMAFDRLNQPGLLDSLREATHGTVNDLELMKNAVKFENFGLSLEQMGTFLAFAQQQAKDTGQSVEYLVDSIVTGLGRKSLPILDNLGLSSTEIKERMKETGDMTKAVADIIKDRMEKSGGYIETAADRAAQAQVRLDNAMMELGNTFQTLTGEASSMWTEIKIGAIDLLNTAIKPLIAALNAIAAHANVPSAEDILTRGMTDVTDTVDDNGRLIRKNAIASIPEITVTGALSKKTGKGGGATVKGPSASDFEKFIGKAAIGASGLKGSDDANFLSPYAMMLDEIKTKILDIKDADLGSALDIPDVYAEKMKEMDKNLKAVVKSANITADVVGSIGDAFSAIEDPAAKVAGTVMQAIASVALGYAQATVQASEYGPWAWIAFAASGLATMMTTIASIHSATGYATGGEIKGNSYSGDNIPIMANAGEVVLTKAMTRTLAANLQGNGIGNMNLRTKVKGTELLVWLDNSLAQSGRGELVTWGQ